MSVAIAAVATIAVVVAILLFVAFGLFELTPFASHAERFRDSRGRRVGAGPRLD